MLFPFKILGVGVVVCLAFVAMGVMDLTKGLGRVVLASTLLAVAPLLGLVAMVFVCARLAKGATREELTDEFGRWRAAEVRRRRMRQISRALDGMRNAG